jgi:hypothetical protein
MEENLTTLQILQILIPVVVAFIASSGFWLFIASYKEKKSLQTRLMIGLAHTQIIQLGMRYIERGWITQDEYENLNVYLYEPYEKMGGNGSAKRIMLEVDRLPIKKQKIYDQLGDTLP